MKRLMTLLLSVLVFTTAWGGVGDAAEGALEAVGLSENVDVQAPPGPASVDDVLARMAADGFNGIVLIDQPSGLRIAPMGTADGPDGPPVDENTVFDIGSITKQFTGAAIVRLEMDGALSVADRLGDHLTELDGPLGEITLHQLLTHTGGLPDGIGDDYEPIDRRAFLERAMTQVGAPGAYSYSNVGYSLLGMVIETVTGQSYEAYLREAFFEPAGMSSTGYVLPDFGERSVAVGYDGDERLSAPHELEWADDGPWWNLRANGGILSTAADMRRWHAALDGADLLSVDAKAELFARHVEEGPGSGTYYGYGWVSFPHDDGRWYHGHNGGNGIFFADLLRFDEGTLIFLATNTSGADEDAALRIADAFFDGDVGAVCLPPLNPTSFAGDESFPDTDAGKSAAALAAILLAGDESARRSFAQTHVSEQLAEGATIDEQVAQLAQLQQEFVGYTVDMVHVEDSLQMHVAMASPDGPPLVVSVVIDDEDPALISCVQIEIS